MSKSHLPQFKTKLIFLLILLIAGSLRFFNLNWDSGQYLHPDERFLTMLSNDMSLPQPFLSYFDPQLSSFNPTNNGRDFYVYGVLPVILNKLIAIGLNNDNLLALTLQGRALTACFDLLTLILIFRLGLLLEKKYRLPQNLSLWASFLYAITVLPIQLSHFFTVDPFLNFFGLLSFYWAFKYHLELKKHYVGLSGLAFGLSLACKVSAVLFLPLLFWFFLTPHHLSLKEKIRQFFYRIFNKNIIFPGRILKILLINSLIFAASAYLTLRLTDPYLFTSRNFLDPRINSEFISDLKLLKSWEGSHVSFPPALQWINKPPIIFALTNLAVFGVGLPYFLFILVGLIQIFWLIKKNWSQYWGLLLIAAWTIGIFIFQSTQFVKSMRYFLIIYPLLSLLAGLGVVEYLTVIGRFSKPRHFLSVTLPVAIISLVSLWPLMFMAIYLQPHSRVQASVWIYRNLPNDSTIAVEHWDDALPLKISPCLQAKNLKLVELPVFAPDSQQKWQEIDTTLAEADYYILSSNRAWASMTTLPQRFPQTTQFYQDLLTSKLEFKKIAEFTSYPSLRYLGIPLDLADGWAEEAFTVYDHPQVMIFEKR